MGVIGFLFRLIRNILAIIGLCTVIVAIVIGALIWSFTQPSAIEGTMHEVEYDGDASTYFDSEWDRLLESGGVVEITEEMISSKITDAIGELGIPMNVKHVWVNFYEGSTGIKVAIVGNLFGLEMHVAAQAVVDIVTENGTRILKYTIIDYSLPEQVKNIIEDNIEDRFDIAFTTGVEREWEIPENWDIELTSIALEELVGEYEDEAEARYQLVITAATVETEDV